MTVLETDVLQGKRKTIQRGAYWFGIIGRLSLLYGIVSFVALILYVGIMDFTLPSLGVSSAEIGAPQVTETTSFGDPIMAMIYGWLFLLGRDAFAAIDLLIAEMNDIV